MVVDKTAETQASLVLTKIYTLVYTDNIRKGMIIMMTAKVFENGRSQAVRLPKECRFNTDEVAVNRTNMLQEQLLRNCEKKIN